LLIIDYGEDFVLVLVGFGAMIPILAARLALVVAILVSPKRCSFSSIQKTNSFWVMIAILAARLALVAAILVSPKQYDVAM
jgi:hypothetical protein